MDHYSNVVGFNYQPTYGWNSFENWRQFDAAVIEHELALGKRYFPKMNTVRIWLSYEAFRYEEDRQAENFETMLGICAKYGLKAIPVLFNCWHDGVLDNGGIYLPMMIEGALWCSWKERFDSYFKKIVAPHAHDERILLWDICNEPYSFGNNEEFRAFSTPIETKWLHEMTDRVREAGATQPCGISHFHSIPTGQNSVDKTAEFTDVLLIHPYFFINDEDVYKRPQDDVDKVLEGYKRLSERFGKPLLTTETCWGSRNDKVRAEIIRRTLTAHKKAGIGYIAHALWWSHVADLHDPEDGPVGNAGNLMFITRDGKIRPGHEVFNEF